MCFTWNTGRFSSRSTLVGEDRPSPGTVRTHLACRRSAVQCRAHFQSGRFEGTPILRGNLSGQLRIFLNTSNFRPRLSRSLETRPNASTSARGHLAVSALLVEGRVLGLKTADRGTSSPLLSPDAPPDIDSEASPAVLVTGGSETTSKPPTRTRGDPHSATTAGGPKLRATTTSSRSRRVESRPADSARSFKTSTCSSRPQRRTARARNPALLLRASSKRILLLGNNMANTRPGMPPPEPRSRIREANFPPGALTPPAALSSRRFSSAQASRTSAKSLAC